MRHRAPGGLLRVAGWALLLLWGCGNQVSLEGADASMSVVVPDQPNAAANGVDTVPITLRLARANGAPLVGVSVLLSASHCIVVQPATVTDALGVAHGKIRCNAPTQEMVRVSLVFNNATALLAPIAQVNFFPSDSSGGVTAGTELLAQAVATDDAGGLDVTYRGTVSFSSSDPLASLPAPYTFAAADLGYKALGKSLVLRTVGRQTVTCRDANTGRVLSTQTYDVLPLAVTSLRLEVDNAAPRAADSVSVTVRAVDGFGNLNPAFREKVAFASSDPLATLPSAYTFTADDAGVKSFVGGVALRTSGPQIVFVSGGGLSGLQKLNVAGGSAAGLQLAVDANVTAGASVAARVTAVDAYGNISPGYTGVVRFSASAASAQLPADLAFTPGDAGVKSATLVMTQAGVTTVGVADRDDASVATASNNVLVAAGAPAGLVLNTPVSALAGQSLNLVVAAIDAYGNTSPGYTGTVALQVSDPQATFPASYTFTASDRGAHAFVQGLRVITAGDTVVRAHDVAGAVQDGNRTTAVAPAALAAVQVVAAQQVITAGDTVDLAVAAVDSYSNVVPSYTGTVQLTNPDPNGTVVSSVSFGAADAGYVSIPSAARFTTSGLWPVVGVDPNKPALMALPANVTVNAGPLVSITLTGLPTSASVAQQLTPKVAARDVYGNPVASYRGTIHFSSTDANAILPADHTFTAQDAGTLTWNAAIALFTVSNATRVSVQDSVYGAPVNSPNINVQHRCGYFDSANAAPNFGGFVDSQSTAFDSLGRPYTIASVELGATYYQDWQAYAIQWMGNAWDFKETPPRPATSVIDIKAFTSYINAPSVALDANDNPTVAYYGSGAANGIYVMQRRGSTWSQLGTSGQTPIGLNGSQPILRLDAQGNPWVLWVDNAGQLHLKLWTGTQWMGAGGNELIPGAVAQAGYNSNRNYDMVLDSQSNAYVVWAQNAAQPSVQLLQWNGAGWAGLAGSNAAGGISQSAGQALQPYVAILPGDLPAVSWNDNASGHTEIYLRQYNGAAWVEVGGSATGGGISRESATALNLGLSVDRHGRLMALWVPTLLGNCAAANVPMHFMRWSGTAWAGVNRSATYTGCDYVDELDGYGGSGYPKLGTDANDVPVLTWRSFGASGACAFY